ncbi:TPA: sensor histidine kinase [Vibrio fluvialis clinical-1]|nr:ATP-binding protein [Vibrio fluvialis]HDM8033868.1 sensor histidine kinase [Vibrio fluvialis clinical-1]
MANEKIRPASRLLKTVGEDLIKDVYAAIAELVKNSYDADSEDVKVKFSYDTDANKLVIAVTDKGDGMSRDTVVNKWLVPATNDKLKRRISHKGRVLQGRKGIGRFAATVLGTKIKLKTVSSGWLTKLTLDMHEVEKYEYLDQLNLDVDSEQCDKQNGTVIEIETDNISEREVRNIWTSSQFRKLLIELRSLTAPQEIFEAAEADGFKIAHDKFDITLEFADFPIEAYSNKSIKIEPFPLLGLFDYRIYGYVSSDGTARLKFENQNVPAIPAESIAMKIPVNSDYGERYPGEFYVDLRVYDRDPDSIDNIIKRGLKDPYTGEYVGRMEARRIIDEYYGVGIYREQFKIRPYGDQSFDWLDLDKKRVQTPAIRIGHNQIIGFVNVRHEEVSGLEEKSARDGLIENGAYFGLVTIIDLILKQLESRRLSYRKRALKGRRSNTLDEDLTKLFDFDKAQSDIASELRKLESAPELLPSVSSTISEILNNEQKKKSEIERKIRDTLAVYQGQATLGKISHVLLHSGRKHIKYINEASPRVVKWINDIIENPSVELIEKVKDRSDKVVTHSKGLARLFKKIEPLARTSRSPDKVIDIEKEILAITDIFELDITEKNIKVTVANYSKLPFIKCNEIDVTTVFSDLIENSIFWLGQVDNKTKEINISIYDEGKNLIIEYLDNGPGFQGDNLELMFEPGYSMKPGGTGLGLALAGEAMNRIGGKIEAKVSASGAAFDILIKRDK